MGAEVSEKKLFFISGHGRSGTNYMAHLFAHFGYKVGPQLEEPNGQSHNFPTFWPFKNVYTKYRYLIQVVRNPKLVVESTFLARYFLPRVYARRIPDLNAGIEGRLEQAVNSLIVWNQRISEAKPQLVVRVEAAPAVCREWLKNTGLSVSANGELPQENINRRTKIGWDLKRPVPWNSLDREWVDKLNEHSRAYGYGECL